MNKQVQGVAMVELAILMPLLVMLVFGVVEMGRVLYYEQVVTKSAATAARYLSRAYNVLDSDDCSTLADWGDHVSTAKDLAVFAGTDFPVVSNIAQDNVEVNVSRLALPSPATPICVIKVEIAVQFDGLFGETLIPFTRLPAIVLNATVDAVYIGE